MSMFARVIRDSISPQGIRLLTFHVRYWRAIHSELMTHAVFSRNARSSRAVPSRVLLTEQIFIPQFGMNQPGMQSEILAPQELQDKWGAEWEELAGITRSYVERWSNEKMHKQHANRPLEWFGWIDVQITSVYWENFWALRISEYAQPEFDELARAMRQARNESSPHLLMPGEWHLPWISKDDWRDALFRHRDIRADGQKRWEAAQEDLKKLSVARSARLSYKPFDGEGDWDREMERYEKLVVSQPVHASPAGHQAMPDEVWPANHIEPARWKHPELHGNLYGWVQMRKTLPNEAVMEKWVIS